MYEKKRPTAASYNIQISRDLKKREFGNGKRRKKRSVVK